MPTTTKIIIDRKLAVFILIDFFIIIDFAVETLKNAVKIENNINQIKYEIK